MMTLILKSQSTFCSLLLCRFLKSIFSKTFNETVLRFRSFESKTNIVYVNIIFIENLILRFSRYWGKVPPESTVFYLFRASILTNNVFSIFLHVNL